MWVLATVSKGNNRRIRSFRYVDCESRIILESLHGFSIGSFRLVFIFISLRRESLISQKKIADAIVEGNRNIYINLILIDTLTMLIERS